MSLTAAASWSAPGLPPLALLEAAFDAVVLLSPEGTITWANPGFERLTGFGRTQPVPELLLGALAEAGYSLPEFRQQLAAAQPLRLDLPLRHADGRRLWVRLKVVPQPAPEPCFGLLEDLTASQQAAQEQNARFSYLTEHVPGVLFQWHRRRRIGSGLTYISPQLTAMFGIAPEQAHRLADFIHPDDRAAWQSSLRQMLRQGTDWAFEGRLVVPGQPERWCRGSARLSSADATHGQLYSGIITDITPLKLAEESVQAHEQRWRLAIERFGDGAWEFNYQTGEEYFSAAYRAMLGYSGRQPLPATWEQHVHPDDRQLSLDAANRYLRGEAPIYSVERRLRCADGHYKWVLTRGLVTLRDEQGQPLIMTGVHTDISAMKQAVAALEASTLRLSTTIANFQEGILLEDENHRVVLANEALCRIFALDATPTELVGYDTSLLGQRVQGRFRHPEEFARRYDAIVQNQQLVTAETFELADGRTVQGDFVPIFVAERYIGHLWKFEDVTERLNSEQALRRREEKYRGIIDNMKLGLVEMDLESHVTFTNQAFCDITGYCDDEFATQHIMSVLVSPDDLRLTQERAQRRRAGESETYELAIRTKGGQAKWLLVSAAPLYNDERQVVGSIGIALDITHQKQLENHLRAAKEQAEDSARVKELFLANMSHEIRTPLNAILGMGQLLAKTPLDSSQQTYLRAIATSGENLLVILNDILDLSKIGVSQLLIERIGFSVPELLRQIEKSLHFKAEEKSLSFLAQADERLPAVLLGDPYRITQVLLNLAGNALKFTEKGSVTINCMLEQATATSVALRFEVADTGIGIDADYLVDIFKEFSQEDSSVTRKFGGTGLGLSISRQLVQLMGGEIRIDSRKHHGTRSHFTLRLPIGTAADLPQKTLVTASIRARLQGLRILLVEDNQFNRQIARGFLHNAGLLVQEAENGAVAVELARHYAFDAVLMDVQMPVMNGLEATARLREQLKLATPIIALTANAIKGERERCLAAGMNDYLAKPFQEDDLLKTLARWTLGEITAETAVGPATPEPPAKAAPLYNLDLVRRVGQNDPAFTALMLESFIEGCEEAIAELQTAVSQQDTMQLRAAAHKLKPSLDHLHVHHILPAVAALDTWRAPFDAAVLSPLVTQTVELLGQLAAQMKQELRELQGE